MRPATLFSIHEQRTYATKKYQYFETLTQASQTTCPIATCQKKIPHNGQSRVLTLAGVGLAPQSVPRAGPQIRFRFQERRHNGSVGSNTESYAFPSVCHRVHRKP